VTGPGDRDREPRPLARLRLRPVPRRIPGDRAPVFHVFEELYRRATHQGAEGEAGSGGTAR
jgi:hypothetical protein